MLSRRAFLQTGAALALTPLPARAAQDARRLTATVAEAQIAPEGYGSTSLWTYDGTLPGTELRFRQGGRLAITAHNALPQETAIHWHGIAVPNAMDGVPGLTQDAIAPGQSFDYSFDLPDAGSYWYHSHMHSTEQIERGLYGALIIDEADAPDIDADVTLVLDDILLAPDAQIAADFNNLHDMSHAGRHGNIILTNGLTEFRQSARTGDRLRLRLINAATARIFQLGLHGLRGWVMALDGMPLAAPQPVDERFVLAPAQRIDLFVDIESEPGETAALVHFERNDGFAQASFDVTARSARVPRSTPAALPPNPSPRVPDLANAVAVPMRMEGGMMGGLQSASYQGRTQTPRELMQSGQFWALNGTVGMTETPLADLARGQTLRMAISNDTVFPHAMHLHGQHFAEVLPGGGLGPWRDTLLVQPNARQDIAFVAGNPGKWLFHCHMVAHMASGMNTWINTA